MRDQRTPWHARFIAVVLCLAGLLACSTSREGSGDNLVNAQGSHPAGFITSHIGVALASIDQCKACHGQDLAGGISKASCFTAACHHDPIPGWALPGVHGLRAKLVPDGTGAGFASCQICHGATFATPLKATNGTLNSCASCHGVAAPHPAKPWRATASNHATTHPANAAVCAKCHFPGAPANPAGHPGTAAPAGTPPGCFNNTLCHGPGVAPHALGAVWTDATSGAFHGFQAKKDLASCQTCHGTPGTTSFAGGSASTKCTACHTQGKAHANVWHAAPVTTFPGYVASHRDAGNRDVACAICHDGTKGRTAPDPAAPSCFSATANSVACHVNGPGQPNHAVPFLTTTHTGVVQAGFDANCGLCHAVSGVSPIATAPLCNVCHQAGSPLTQGNCTSCHAKPPVGTAFPDIAGSHAKHNALATVTGACAACHQAADSGTQTHYDHANGRPGRNALRVGPGVVATDPAYNAKAGAVTFNATTQTCGNVSCHGGQTTPGWLNGTLATTTEAGCRACHALGTAQGTPESNSPYSGLHALHLNSSQNLQCVECHNMANGTTGALNHFKSLHTAPMEGPAGQTVAFSTTTPAAVYDVATQGCGAGGAFSCHGRAHSAASTWKGGGSHAVPYTGTAHTGVNNQTSFTGSCGGCHAVSGPSPVSSAPLCTTCHQAGSPLLLANCASCHGKPPVGTVFPDVAGTHGKHNALTGFTAQCSTCHSNADAGSQTHYDHANARPGKDALRVAPGETAFLAAVSGKSGAASFDGAAMTCSNIRCHGGLTAPSWRTGSIAVNTEAGCRACHSLGTASGLPESNSAYSGLHAFHLGGTVNAQCVDCHNLANGSPGALNHFTALGTTQMEGPASGTISLAGGTYTPATQACTVTCHSQVHSNFSWAGGANHGVPYQAAAHTAVNQAGFDANCKTCHALTGSVSPMSTAPTCATCHTAGSPLAVANCASCHSKPPVGSAFPDIAGKHAKHNALPELAGSCADCHSGADTGSTTHYSHANNRPGLNGSRLPPGEVAFPGTTYNAKTGPAAFNSSAQTCSNVSCHGGQSVAWTATINVNTQCTACHTASGTAQYNSPSSGQHSRGDHVSAGCVACHNVSTLAAAHFVGLKTTTIDSTAAKASVGGGSTRVTSYNGTSRNCTTSCHGSETW